MGLLQAVPELPEWPNVKLQYSEACKHYYISETDVDLILNYVENDIPRYKYDMELFSKMFKVVEMSMQ